MSFEKFFGAISRLIPQRHDDRARILSMLSALNPDKIYLENVRSVLDVSAAEAKRILEAAERQGLISRGVEVLCPDGSVAASADSESNLPLGVRCWSEQDGHFEERVTKTEALRRNVFYRLNEQPVTSSHR